MEKNYLKLENISSYQKSYDLANQVWDVVLKWDYFAKDTIGKQFVRSTDSISANIAEGFGRYSKKDKIRFYRISLGSLEETFDWISKSSARLLMNENIRQCFIEKLNDIKIEIYHLIKYTNEKLKY